MSRRMLPRSVFTLVAPQDEGDERMHGWVAGSKGCTVNS